MKPIKAGAAVPNQIPLNWTGNREGLSAAIRQAKSATRQRALPA